MVHYKELAFDKYEEKAYRVSFDAWRNRAYNIIAWEVPSKKYAKALRTYQDYNNAAEGEYFYLECKVREIFDYDHIKPADICDIACFNCYKSGKDERGEYVTFNMKKLYDIVDQHEYNKSISFGYIQGMKDDDGNFFKFPEAIFKTEHELVVLEKFCDYTIREQQEKEFLFHLYGDRKNVDIKDMRYSIDTDKTDLIVKYNNKEIARVNTRVIGWHWRRTTKELKMAIAELGVDNYTFYLTGYSVQVFCNGKLKEEVKYN